MVAVNRYLTSSLDKFTNFATKEDFRSNNSEHLLVFSRVNCTVSTTYPFLSTL